MTEVNTTKFYQFLSKYQQNGETWADVADSNYGNDDGTVIKAEFRKFINAEWNGEENGEMTNDLINSFWKKIDTNTSASKISGTKLKNLNALDKKELANLDKQLEIYVEFDKFVANNVKVPSVLTSTGSQWKSAVTNELSSILEAFIAGGANGDLNAILTAVYQTIANECTAQYCAVEYQETLKDDILAEYPEYKVADDKTLDTLIKNYIQTVGTDITPDQIKEDIVAIMDAYLATAGLGDGSAYAIEDLGYDESKLNDIQIAVIAQTIKNDLKEEAKKYEGFENEFNTAVQQFVEDKIKKGGDFETLKGSAAEFANSKFKKQLDNTVTINTTYKDVTEDSDFYKRLVEEFGETLAKKIAQNDRYIQAYKDIINDVATKVNAGEMTIEEVADYIVEQISANLDKFFTNGLGDMSIEELNETYDKLVKAADEQKDDDLSLQQHRDAAIKYCDAISKKSNELKEAVKEAFGTSDYKSAINNMYPGEIQEVMTELKAKALEIGDIKDFTLETLSIKNGGAEITGNLGVTPNSTGTLKATATIKNGNNTIDSNRISYSITATNGTASIDSLGNIKYTAGNETGYMTMEVQVMVDGIKVGEPKTIKITISRDNSAIIEDIKSKEENSGKINCTDKYITSESLEKYSFSSLYNNDVAIRLYDANKDGNKFDSLKPTVKTKLTSVLTTIVSMLTEVGLNTTILNTCKNNVLNKYMNGFTGTDVSPWDRNAEQVDADNAAYNHVHSNRNQITYAHVRANDWHADNHSVMVNFKDLVDDMLAEYRKQGGIF